MFSSEAQDAYETDGQHDMVAEMQTNIGLVHRSWANISRRWI